MAVDTPIATTAADPPAANATISGLDALELAGRARRRGLGRRIWSATWPKLAALALVIAVWQSLVWAEWKDPWILVPPADVFGALGQLVGTGTFWKAVGFTLQRALVGFGIAAVIGFVVGVAVARIKPLRAAIGSTITGLQTMPSVAWYPLAIVFFALSPGAMYFVVILGAAPSIANGVIAGVDYVPPLLLRAGKNIGAKGINLYTHVIAPASLPSIVAGLKQGWAFAWRSLMAGELLVLIPGQPGLGAQMQFARDAFDNKEMFAYLAAVFVIGILADGVFSRIDTTVRRRWGVLDAATDR